MSDQDTFPSIDELNSSTVPVSPGPATAQTPESASALVIQFKGEGMSDFGFSRQNVSTTQLYAAAMTLLKIADTETEIFAAQILLREQQKAGIIRPSGVQIPNLGRQGGRR